MPELQVFDVGEAQERGQSTGEGLPVRTLRTFLEDCRWQPPWRNMADKCVDYYDGNQTDFETLDALGAKGMSDLQRNIIQPLVNVVLGMEARTRSDWRVSADNDIWQPVAEGLSAKLHEAERETRADWACSQGYAGQIKAGLHWVEVSRSADPFEYPHRVAPIHRREMWWDWKDETLDLHKSRFVLRKRWFDVDQAIAYFPEHKELLRATVGDPLRYELLVSKRALDLGMSLEEARGLDIEDMEEWRSIDRQRLCLYEVWYRQFTRGIVARLQNGQVVEIDTKNPVHIALLNRGAIRPERAVYSKLRMSMWAGPHRLMDVAHKSRHLPYVPFWGYREDRTGIPYGLVRSMISPQDEVNARLRKMMWLLGAKRVMMDSDALDKEYQSPQDMLAEISRPDAVIIRNPNRTNRTDAIEVNDNLQLADAQFKVLQDAIMSAQQVVGVFNEFLGKGKSGQSGEAINSLVDQGTMALAEINDNYRYSRRLVGERLLDGVREDLIGQEVEVQAGDPGRRRTIILNQRVKPQPRQLPGPMADQRIETMPESQEEANVAEMIKNNVAAAKVKVALDDVPSSPAYREQQFTSLAELTKGLPPNLQAIIAPFVIEASDLNKRREVADTLRKAMGLPTPRTAEEEKEAEAAQAEAMQFAQEIQRKTALAELAEREAKVMQLRAQAEKALAEARADPNVGEKAAAEARAEFEERVRDIERQAQADIDKLTADMMTVRMSASTREQKLLGNLAALTAQLKMQAGNKEIEARKSQAEIEVAKIEKDREVEVARINAASKAVVDGLVDQIAKVRAEMEKKVEDAKAQAEKAAERAAKDAEGRVREEVRASEKERRTRETVDKAKGLAKEKADKAKRDADDKARKEKEKAAAESAKKESSTKAEPAMNLTVVVDGGGESEIVVEKTADGKYVGRKTSKKKPAK